MVQHQSYILSDVQIWGTQEKVHLHVRDGVLQKIMTTLDRTAFEGSLFNAAGGFVMPAGVDPQVHLRVPGQAHKETAETGLEAAVVGGIGALLTMPNTNPVIDSVEVCEQAARELEAAEKKTGVRVYLSAAISKGQKGKEPVDFIALARWGVRAFTDDGVGVVSDDIMKKAFAASAETGLPILQHAEYPGHGGVLAAGPVQQKLGTTPYPAAAEADMVARDIRLLKDFPGARYHVLHVSARETIELVERAKEQGLQVTCEVSPHHLFFTAEDIREENTAFKMNPPLRSKEDRATLREALRTGVCDFVATDHAPHEPAAKGQNFKTSAYGTTGLETSLRTLLTLWHEKQLSTERVVEVFASGPAKFLGIDRQFGSIEIGKLFNGVLFDIPTTARSFEEKELRSMSHNNCFVGSRLNGKICGVFLGNNINLF